MSPATPAFRLGHRPGLDGLRGVAILTVLADHGGLVGDGFGFLAVNTFFVLSGFLITSLLVLEWQATGKINFAHFYLRRALRLLPALLAMLIAFTVYVTLTKSGKELNENLHEVFWALFYFTNWAKAFQIGPTFDLAHTWSLSVEEQFYFCWPWLLWFLLRKNSAGSLLCWLALGITLAETTRVFLFVGDPGITLHSPDRVTVGLDVRADSLLMGGFVGIMAVFNRLQGWQKWNRGLTFSSAASVLGLFWLGRFSPIKPEMVYVGWLAASFFAALIILQLILGSGSWMHWLLENPGLVYIGQISYGLYVWHFVILKALQRYDLPWRHLCYVIPVFAVAVGSFYLIERPCLRLKQRFQKAQ